MLLSLLLPLLLLAPAPAQTGPDEEYQFLVGLSEKGMHDLVVQEATDFLGSYPRHEKASAARYRLALALFELDRLPEAAPHFQRLARSDGFEFRAEAAMRFGQCRLAEGEHGQAAAAFEEVLGYSSDYLELPATFLLAEARFRGGDFEAAEARYLRVLELPENDAYSRDSLYGAAWCAFRLDHFDDAVARAREFERRHGSDELVQEMRFLAGEARLEAGDARGALADYQRVDGGPFADAAMRGAGFAAAELSDHEQAAQWFGRLLAEHPASPYRAEAALQQGIHLLQAGDDGAALAVLAGDLPGATPEALYWRGVAQARGGSQEDALASFDAALRRKPGEELTGRIQAARGDALYELGRLDEASESYRLAESDYALHAAVVSNLNDGRAEQAVALAERLLEEYPDSRYVAKVRLAMGEGLLRQERYAEAEAAFAASTAGEAVDDAHLARAASRVGWCRYLLGDPAGAAGNFAAVAGGHPDSPEAEEAAYMEGRSRFESGDEPGARAAWTRYLERHPGGGRVSEVMFRLGRMAGGAEGLAQLEGLIAAHAGSAEAPKALYELGERLYAEGRVAEAEANFVTLLTAHPRHPLAPAAGYALAWCQFDLERFEDAASLLPQVAEAAKAAGDPELHRSSLELLVWAAKEAGDATGAAEAFLGFGQTGPEEASYAAAAKVVAAALQEAGDADGGYALLGAARKRVEDPGLASDLEVERCYLALDAGKPAEAEAAARAALEVAPENPVAAEAAFFVGEAWFAAGEDGRAVPLYAAAAAVAGHPVADRALYKLGYAELRQERAEAAVAAFAALIADHADSVLYGEALFLHGEALFRLARFEESVASLQRLHREIPEHQAIDRCLFRLGVGQCQVEDWEAASATLAELARRFPDFANGTEGELWRGRALAALDQRRASRQAFERVLARDQGVLAARARLGLGKLELAAGQVEGALSEFLKVAVLYSQDDEVAEGLYFAGLCLERLGDPDRAADQYREITTKYSKTAYAAQARERLQQIESEPR
ncbi:MAG: tetratricopeptide repeat protein [Planctomycetes bacterium]|nr:tetratricopeptide repeat protein [Planctomycetota bacterium]MBL7009265.1 tetratricopeptide repeat protein [Planctomycetota bacterium]